LIYIGFAGPVAAIGIGDVFPKGRDFEVPVSREEYVAAVGEDLAA
jgi:hypothetical protein